MCIGVVNGCFADMSNWMATPQPPSSIYCTLMECHLVVLDKIPVLQYVGIRETLYQALAKLFLRVAGGQAKIACGNIQL